MGRNTLPYALIKRKKTGIWKYRIEGMKSYATTGTKNEAAAKDVLKAALQKAELTAEGLNTLKAYIEPFYDYERCPHIQRIGRRSITRKSARIVRAYIKNHVLTDPIADMVISGIKTRDITQFRARLEKKMVMSQPKKAKPGKQLEPLHPLRPLAPATIDKIMNALKTVFGEAVINRDIEYNPCSGIVRLGGSGENQRGAYTMDELKTLFDSKNWTNQEARYCFMETAITGMRCGEILAFPWGCGTEKELAIVNAWKDTHEEGEPKGEKPRTVPNSKSSWRLLEEYKKTRILKKLGKERITRTEGVLPQIGDTVQRWSGEQYSPPLVVTKENVAEIQKEDDTIIVLRSTDLLFCDPATGERRGATWWSKNFRSAMEKSRLPENDANGFRRTPHSLRHTLNTQLLVDGVSPVLVREYLGWCEDGPRLTKVQSKYTHVMVMDMAGLVGVIDRLFEPIVGKE